MSRIPRRYGVVLALVAVTYLVSSASGAENQPVGVLLQVTTAWFALLTAEVPQTARRVVGLALVVIAVAAVLASVMSATVVVLGASVVLYVVAPVAVLRHLAIRPVVDGQTLSGAVASYAMIGMLFAFCYQLLGVLQTGPFFGAAGDPATAWPRARGGSRGRPHPERVTRHRRPRRSIGLDASRTQRQHDTREDVAGPGSHIGGDRPRCERQ